VIARVTSYQIQPGWTDEVVSLIRDDAIPAATEQVGFRGLLMLVSPTGKASTIALWESKENVEASEVGGFYATQMAKIAPLLAGPPVREFYDVVLDHR
jgi:hypothetical protein